MIIEQIDLINFKKYAQERIMLGRRIIGVFGNNGAGKSTIFDAICWCLYGATPTIGKEGQNVKQDDLVKDGEDEMGVELQFTYSQQSYTVARYYSKTDGTKARVLVDGVLEATSSKDVTSYVSKTLGLDAKAFISASFIRQNEIDLLTSQRPSKRKEVINRLFNLQQYEAFLEDTRELQRDIIRELAIKEEKHASISREIENYKLLSHDTSSLKKQLKDAEICESKTKKNLDSIRDEKERINAVWSSIRRENERKRHLLKKKHELEDRKTKLGQDIKILSNSQKRLESDLREQEKLSPYRDKYLQMKPKQEKYILLNSKLKSYETDLISINQTYESTFSSLKKRKISVKEKISDLEKRHDFLKKPMKIPDISLLLDALNTSKLELEKIRSRLVVENSKLESSKIKSQELNVKRGELENLKTDAMCPTCNQVVDKEHRTRVLLLVDKEFESSNRMISYYKKRISKVELLRDERIEKLASLEDEINNARKTVSQQEKNVELAKQIMDTISYTLDELSSINEEIESIESKYKQNKGTLEQKIADTQQNLTTLGFCADIFESLSEKSSLYDTVSNEILVFQAKMANFESYNMDYRAVDEELLAIDSELDTIESTMKSMKKDVEGSINHNESISKLEERIAALQREQGTINEQLNSDERIKESIRISKDTLFSLSNEIDLCRKSEHEYSILIDAFRSIPINIHERLKPLLQNEVSALLSDVTHGRYSAVQIDEEYTIQVLFEGVFYPIYRFSGGEKDLINLCLRIGISRVLVSLSKVKGFAHLESLFLDETFSSLDGERKLALLSVLNRLETYFSQIVIITHVEELRELIPTHILVEEDEDNNSSAKQITCSTL